MSRWGDLCGIAQAQNREEDMEASANNSNSAEEILHISSSRNPNESQEPLSEYKLQA